MKPGFRFVPDEWFGNRALRACTPAARGFWADLLALMHPTGELVLNGMPLSDEQIAQLVGSSVRQVRSWINELGTAGIFTIVDGKLCSTRMQKTYAYEQQAKAAGKRSGRPKQKTAPVIAGIEITSELPPNTAPTLALQMPPVKPAAWWLSPAGWARQADKCALSLKPDETIFELQVRVAAKLPPGPHLDVLTPAQLKMVDALIPKDAKMP